MKLQNIVAIISVIILAACAPTNVETPITVLLPSSVPTLVSPTAQPTSTRKPIPTKTSTSTPKPQPTSTSVPLKRLDGDKISGTYKVERTDGGECVIKVIFEPNTPFDEIGFEVFCIRGAPSYNSGGGLGRLMMANNKAVYAPTDDCSIVLEFKNNKIEVTQIGMDFDCGFGANVTASGTYQLIDDKPPVIGCMRPDNPCGLPVPIP